MVTFSLCMIVKNESAVLRRCLQSVAGLMDEIIIVDTGSTDGTKEIAKEFTDQIYDYEWEDDFSAARNFAFSKAGMDYIYSADADEVVDAENYRRLLQLKQAMLPEIEIVQMYYVTPDEYNTVLNYKKEYRPKLYKRLRTFFWEDAVHETVRLAPVVFDSDVEILHLPQTLHSARDFQIFHRIFKKEGFLSAKLQSMYAKELFISGTEDDFKEAEEIFLAARSREDATEDMVQEASCVLCRTYRLLGRADDFFSAVLKLMPDGICSELCCEIGSYFMGKKDEKEAIEWFEMAAYRTEPVIDIRYGAKIPFGQLAVCCRKIAEKLSKTPGGKDEEIRYYSEAAERYGEKVIEVM